MPAGEHVWHSDRPEEPWPYEKCCCGKYEWGDNPFAPTNVSKPWVPGRCNFCGQPLDTPGHAFLPDSNGGQWICYRK